ncbi:MAG TPA: D-alanyl-D-alanine carboxypeptidase family protein [Nostocaceae cyanobacterium]|nr:D-alanyl-D-alanine carboxypeptidase family protein [Nostocaceae cyanobacterium]
MKRIFRKATFITIVVSIIFLIVGSHEIIHRTSEPTASAAINPNTPTPVIIKPPIPALPLNDQQRFLNTIANKLSIIPQPGSYEYILLRAYGSVFLNQDFNIRLPQKVLLNNEQETKEFQSTLTMVRVDGTRECFLQKPAADALNKAKLLQNIRLKSGNVGDCTRTFALNQRFWQKYANNRTLNAVKQGRETRILGVVAPPGSSQHLWGLAIDLQVYSPLQREALNQNGWFQTVENDVPHWTYLGLAEEDLPNFGLRPKVVRGITYWLTPI